MIAIELGFMNTKINASPEDKGGLPRTKGPEAILGASEALRHAMFPPVFLSGNTVKRGYRQGEAQFRRHGRELLRKEPHGEEKPRVNRMIRRVEGGYYRFSIFI